MWEGILSEHIYYYGRHRTTGRNFPDMNKLYLDPKWEGNKGFSKQNLKTQSFRRLRMLDRVVCQWFCQKQIIWQLCSFVMLFTGLIYIYSNILGQIFSGLLLLIWWLYGQKFGHLAIVVTKENSGDERPLEIPILTLEWKEMDYHCIEKPYILFLVQYWANLAWMFIYVPNH